MLGGCSVPPPSPAPCVVDEQRLAATPLDLWPCARDAAAAWRPGAGLVGVEGSAGLSEGGPDPSRYRALDGLTHEWGFTFADVDARRSRTFVLDAAGRVEEHVREFAWEPGGAVKPHAEGYGPALEVAYLQTGRLREAIAANATVEDLAFGDGWRAYSLVAVAGKRPAWFVGGEVEGDRATALVDPATWTVVGHFIERGG